MPNTLHFLLPCLKLIPRTVNIFLLLNGVKDWEEDYLKKHCANYPIFKLRGLLHSSLPHGSVLNLLIDYNNSNFGIMDHDLYVFNPAIFTGLEFDKAECAIGVFRLTNQKAGLVFPTTHFLFFNTKRIREIRKKYRVGAQVYARIPVRLEPLLDSLGLGYHNFLKEYMHYFDTLNLIFALAFYEKLSIKFLEVSPDDFYHIGGTSSNQGTLFEKYIGLRFLELRQSSVLAQRYASLYGQRTNSRDLWGQLSPAPPPAAFLAQVERMVARIERHVL